ncbi:MAG: YdeI/OmpD-associated family protein [Candidatus Saccharimonadales bacterium]|nr:YdeI/OmpD-associated family protein [Candidatus Saccharimonadales bacterium]
MSKFTIPTELRRRLWRNPNVLKTFRRMSERLQSDYSQYVISATTHKDREHRAQQIVNLLSGRLTRLDIYTT